MVCLPCIILPVCMFIYIKFIMPFVYRILPQRWVTFLDPYLYPTCPVQIPESSEKPKIDESCCSTSTVTPSAPPEEETKKDL